MQILIIGRDNETKKALSDRNHEVTVRPNPENVSSEMLDKADVVIVSRSATRSPFSIPSVVANLKSRADTPLIVMAEFKSVREATSETVKAVKAGAETVLATPVKPVELIQVVDGVAKRTAQGSHLRFGAQLVLIRKALGLSRADFAKILNCSPKSIQDWEESRSTPCKDLGILRELASLAERLQNQFSADEIRRWINAPNRLFKMKKPVDLLKKGNTQAIRTVLRWIETGAHS
jgi:DNA-binding transcriptional regulator YiaG